MSVFISRVLYTFSVEIYLYKASNTYPEKDRVEWFMILQKLLVVGWYRRFQHAAAIR